MKMKYALFFSLIAPLWANEWSSSWTFQEDNWWVYLWVKSPPLPPAIPTGTLGSVDVLTTAMPGEPFAMFERTLRAIVALDYPHRSFLLDGGNDPALRTLCAELGVEHVDARGIGEAKAGKINYCLREHSTSEFVFVIDPDHIPRPDFFARVLPHFHDSSIGFVQVVQAYYNLDESWIAWAAAEQTFGFYGPTLMGLHGQGIPTAIGANCTFRRTALDSIGGHAEHLAEDALTSMRIHAAGWKSAYVPWRGSEGLSPSSLGAFYKQQLKWATGMYCLLLHEYPRLSKHFSPIARLHYLVAGTFYLGGLASALTLWLPIALLFGKVYAIQMPLGGFLVHLLPYAISCTLIYAVIQNWYTRRDEKGLPWRSLLLEKATWHIYVQAFIYSVLGRKVPYIPTPKEGDCRPVPRLVWPHWLVILLSLGAIAYVPFAYPRLDTGTLLMMLLAALNVLTLLPVAWLGLRPLKVNPC